MANFDAGTIEGRLTLDRTPFNEGLRLARADADRFEANDITVRANLDDAKFKTELAALDVQRRRLDGSTIKINVDKNSVNDAANAERTVSGMVSAIVGLGPALIPITGVALGGVAGLGAALTGAAVGAGALYLAFHNMDQSQAGQHLTAMLQGLKGELAGLQLISQQNILPGVETVINVLNGDLPIFTSLLAKASTGIGELEAEAARGLGGPVWSAFFSMIERQGEPDLILLGRAVGGLATGFAGMATAFAPLASRVLVGFEQWATGFATFATTSGSFTHFIGYVEQEGPVVLHVLGVLVQTGVALVQALAPFGGVVLGIIGALGQLVVLPVLAFFNSLPGPVRALAVALGLLIYVGPKISSMFQSLQTFVQGLNERLLATQAVAEALGNPIGRLGAVSGAAKAEVSGLTGSLGSGAVALGAVGLAATAAIGIYSIFAARSQAAKQRTNELTDSLVQQGGAWTQAGRAQLEKNLLDAKADQLGKSLGLTIDSLTNAVSGSSDQYDRQIQALNGVITANTTYVASRSGAVAAENATGLAAGKLKDILVQQRAAVVASNAALDAARGKYDQLRASGYTAAQANAALGTTFVDVAGKASTTALSVQDLNTQIGTLLGRFLNVPQAQAAMITAIDSITHKVVDSTGAFNHNTGSINLNAGAGRNLLSVLTPAITSVQQYSQQVLAQTGSQTQANAAWNAGRQRLINYIAQQVGSKTAAEHLVDRYGLVKDAINNIPNKKATVFSAPGLGDIMGQLAKFSQLVNNLPTGALSPGFLVSGGKSGALTGPPHAAGGRIFGIGTDTSDSMLTPSSKDEYMVKASSARSIGYGTLDYMNQTGQVPQAPVVVPVSDMPDTMILEIDGEQFTAKVKRINSQSDAERKRTLQPGRK